MQEIPLRQRRGVGTRQADRQIDAERHRAAVGRRAQPGEERRHVAHRRPARPAARRLPRVAPPRPSACADRRSSPRARRLLRGHAACWRSSSQSGLCARSSRRAAGPASSPALAASAAFALARASASCWRCLLLQPLLQAHAGLRRALRFVGTLAFAQGLGGLHRGALVAGGAPGFKGLGNRLRQAGSGLCPEPARRLCLLDLHQRHSLWDPSCPGSVPLGWASALVLSYPSITHWWRSYQTRPRLSRTR